MDDNMIIIDGMIMDDNMIIIDGMIMDDNMIIIDGMILGGELPTNRLGGWVDPGDFNGIFVGASRPRL